MPTYEFTATLDRAPEDDDFDRLFEAGLDDTTPETRDGRGVLNVARDAASMTAAILSVARDVALAGFRMVGVEDDDLVSLKTVAQRTGRSYESVRLLASGKRGPGEFPEPLSGDGWALYSWALVADWYSRHYGPEAVPAVSPDQRVLAAASLMLRAAETAGPASAELAELAELVGAASVPPTPPALPPTVAWPSSSFCTRAAAAAAAPAAAAAAAAAVPADMSATVAGFLSRCSPETADDLLASSYTAPSLDGFGVVFMTTPQDAAGWSVRGHDGQVRDRQTVRPDSASTSRAARGAPNPVREA